MTSRTFTVYRRPSLTDLARRADSFAFLVQLAKVMERSSATMKTRRAFHAAAHARFAFLRLCVCGHSNLAHIEFCTACAAGSLGNGYCLKFRARGDAAPLPSIPPPNHEGPSA